MKRTLSIKILLLCALCIFMPDTVAAYFTTNQSATKLNAHTAVFAIEYSFGLKDTDLYMPVLADRKGSVPSDFKHLTYVVLEEGKEVRDLGTATGIVVSKAPIVHEQYKLSGGKSHKMTLFVLLTLPKNVDEADYAIQVTSLPFFEDKGITPYILRQLNPSELQYYRTKEVELNTGVRK